MQVHECAMGCAPLQAVEEFLAGGKGLRPVRKRQDEASQGSAYCIVVVNDGYYGSRIDHPYNLQQGAGLP